MKTKLFMAAAVTVAGLGVGAGVAFGVWTVSGSGAGQGAATVASSLVVTAVAPSGANASLYPGGPAGPVELSINNPNPFAVTVTGLSWGTPISLNPSLCASSNISLDGSAPTTVSYAIAANSTDTDQLVSGVLDLSHGAGNGCEGAGFSIPVTVSGAEQ